MAIMASIAAHVILVAAMLFFAPAAEPPHNRWVLAYLVEFGDKAGTKGASDGSAARARHEAAAAEVSAPSARKPPPRRRPARKPPDEEGVAVREDTTRDADAPAAIAPAPSGAVQSPRSRTRRAIAIASRRAEVRTEAASATPAAMERSRRRRTRNTGRVPSRGIHPKREDDRSRGRSCSAC